MNVPDTGAFENTVAGVFASPSRELSALMPSRKLALVRVARFWLPKARPALMATTRWLPVPLTWSLPLAGRTRSLIW